MKNISINEVFHYDPKPILQYRKNALSEMDSIESPLIGKLNLDSFLVDELKLDNVILTRGNEIPSELEDFQLDSQENIVVIKDGNVVFDTLSINYDNVYINDLQSASDERPELLTEILNTKEKELKSNKMTALNASYFNGGILIDVPSNISVEGEVKVYYIQENSDFVNRTIINVNQNSKINITEYLMNISECYVNTLCDIYLAENASLNYLNVDNFKNNSKGYISLRGLVQNYATLNVNKAFLSEASIIGEVLIDLVGEGATTNVSTFAVANESQKMNINIDTWNSAKYTSSDIKNYGVALGKSELIFNNAGKIEMGMKGSKAFQNTKGVVLTESASVQANPFLLIDEFDVEAGHGATIGAFDEASMFYLMSRGLSKNDAEAMIVSGFISPIIAKIGEEQMRTTVEAIIKEKME